MKNQRFHLGLRTQRWFAALAALVFAVSSQAPVLAAQSSQSTPPPSVSAEGLKPVVFLPFVRTGNSCSNYITSSALKEVRPNMIQVQARPAWDACALGSGVIVAVVDSGVDLDHPDLQANLLPGYDFIQDDADPNDAAGHGTHVAGIIAAGLNGVGVLGIAPEAHILPVRVLDENGKGSYSQVVEGIQYAVSHGAKVINLSLSGTAESDSLRSAIDDAIRKGVVVVAAAGNSGPNKPLEYPAAYPEVLSVAAVDSNNVVASFSDQNAFVDIAAPGVNIYSSYLNGSYISMSGTSMATPHVAGLAALVYSRNPGYNPSQVISAIENTAVDLGPSGRDDAYGYGLINAEQAVSYLAAAISSFEAMENNFAVETQPEDRSAPLQPGRVLVQFVDGKQKEALADLSDVSAGNSIGPAGVKVLHVPAGKEWDVIDHLRQSGKVVFAEPDYLVTAK